MTVSVVIPVYNAASLVDRCVHSVLGQTYSDLDVILVDDGSTDGSGHRCDAWADRDARVRVIHQSNAGVSKARNTGIEASKGAYLLFVDSDDYLEATAAEVLVKALESKGVQLAVGSHYATRVGQDQSILESRAVAIRRCGIKPRDVWFQIRYDDDGPCSKDEVSRVWGKLFLGDVIRRNGLRFREELFWLEDITFCLEYATSIGEAISLPDLVCHHCSFEQDAHTTLTRRVFTNEFENINRAYIILQKVYADAAVSDESRRCLDGFYARNVVGCFIRMFSDASPFSEGEALVKAREICGTPRVRETLAGYRAVAGSSRLIPFLMRRGMVRAAAQVVRLRG